MPRVARAVFSGVAHHITQRGNRREDVFYTDEDRQAYLDWLKEYSQNHRLEILAYCLMTNLIHLVGVPRTEEGLQAVLKLCSANIFHPRICGAQSTGFW